MQSFCITVYHLEELSDRRDYTDVNQPVNCACEPGFIASLACRGRSFLAPLTYHCVFSTRARGSSGPRPSMRSFNTNYWRHGPACYPAMRLCLYTPQYLPWGCPVQQESLLLRQCAKLYGILPCLCPSCRPWPGSARSKTMRQVDGLIGFTMLWEVSSTPEPSTERLFICR